jgi:hypothetical protein
MNVPTHILYDIRSRKSMWSLLHDKNGYWPINVNPLSKKPVGVGWNLELKGKTFVNPFYNQHSVGLVAKDGMYALDIDITHEKLARAILDWFIERYGKDTFLIRYGSKPKYALVFQTKSIVVASHLSMSANVHPFYICNLENEEFKIEHPLQIVGFGIHPTTNDKYEWVNGRSPLTVPLSELPMVNTKHWPIIKENILRIAKQYDYVLKPSKGDRIMTNITQTDDTNDNTIINTVRAAEFDYAGRTVDEVRDLLTKLAIMGHVKPKSSYPEWMLVVYALAQWGYESKRIEAARKLLHEYSKQAPDLYNERDVERQFQAVLARCGTDTRKITLASLYNLLNTDTYITLQNKLNACTKEAEYVALMHDVGRAKIETWEYDSMIIKIHHRTKSFSLQQIKKHCKKNVDPAIFAYWYKISADDLLYHPVLARNGITRNAFNDLYINQIDNALKVGLASDYIKQKAYVDYIPYGEVEDSNTVNMWDSDTAPIDVADEKVSELILRFIYTVYGDKYGSNHDANLLLDIGTAIAKNRGKRLGLLIVIAGVQQGSGKSMTAALFKNIVGIRNSFETSARGILNSNFDKFGNSPIVVMNDPHLENYGSFNEFLKTYVTEPYVPSEKKFKNVEVIPNYRTFIITTNKTNQIQFTSEDRRVLIFVPVLTSKDAVEENRRLFNEMNKLLEGDNSDAIYSFFLNRTPKRVIQTGTGMPYMTDAAKALMKSANSSFQAMINYKIENKDYNKYRLSRNEIIRDAKVERIPYKLKYLDEELAGLGFIHKEIIRDEYGTNDVIYYHKDHGVFD